MPHPDLDSAYRLCNALRHIVIQKFGGWEDRESLGQVDRLCGAAAEAVEDKECRQKLQRIRYYAAELFSDTRHRRWARDSLFGSDVLRLEIVELLDAYRARLGEVEAVLRSQLKAGAGSTGLGARRA